MVGEPTVEDTISILRGLREKYELHHGVRLTDGARRWLGRVGYDPVYGARPLRRTVQKHLQDPLADLILRGAVHDGATVKVDEGDGRLVLSA